MPGSMSHNTRLQAKTQEEVAKAFNFDITIGKRHWSALNEPSTHHGQLSRSSDIKIHLDKFFF